MPWVDNHQHCPDPYTRANFDYNFFVCFVWQSLTDKPVLINFCYCCCCFVCWGGNPINDRNIVEKKCYEISLYNPIWVCTLIIYQNKIMYMCVCVDKFDRSLLFFLRMHEKRKIGVKIIVSLPPHPQKLAICLNCFDGCAYSNNISMCPLHRIPRIFWPTICLVTAFACMHSVDVSFPLCKMGTSPFWIWPFVWRVAAFLLIFVCWIFRRKKNWNNKLNKTKNKK